MAIVRYNPWDVFPSARNLDDFFNISSTEDMSLNVYETDDDVHVDAKLPGFTENDVRINVVGRNLTIEGEVRQEEKEEDKKKKWYREEIRMSSVARSVILPTEVKSDEAEAHFENGILKITLPKAEEAKPKSIEIKAGKK